MKYSFAIELRDKGLFGFLLPPHYIEPTAKELFEGLKTLIGEMKLTNNSRLQGSYPCNSKNVLFVFFLSFNNGLQGRFCRSEINWCNVSFGDTPEAWRGQARHKQEQKEFIKYFPLYSFSRIHKYCGFLYFNIFFVIGGLMPI